MSGSISKTPQWTRLQEHAAEMKSMHLRDLMKDDDRCSGSTVTTLGITVDYARQNINLNTMDMLFDLAKTAGVDEKKAAMARGEHINSTEDRAVMHIALRAPATTQLFVDGVDVVPEVHQVLDRIEEFTSDIRAGRRVGVTGKRLTTVISIGIGGSYLGPEFVFEALKTDVDGAEAAKGRTLRFLANVDPVDVSRALIGCDPESTLVVIVSKTFTTAETMLNARTLKKWLLDHISGDPDAIVASHMIAVSSAIPRVMQFGIKEENIFGFWDWVGGRYSVCSAVGVVPLALQYGMPIVKQFLAGAHEMDNHFMTAPPRVNLPTIMGLLGVWNSTFMGHSTRAILPYAQALMRFPAHIQQVDMESNGKRVGINGEILDFEAGEINFGEPGTNGQHSFYQLIHQGRTIPAEFIGFCKSPNPIHNEGEVVSNHDELMSNFFAQPDALALGKTISELQAEGCPIPLQPHKAFPGNKPSMSILFNELNAYTVGQLLALYEHRTAVQGFVWGINSFDQWGVELGKVLATKVRSSISEARGGGGSLPDTVVDEALKGFNKSTASLMKRFLQTR